jgi:poly(3-hydroxybutyrate) depolymerase
VRTDRLYTPTSRKDDVRGVREGPGWFSIHRSGRAQLVGSLPDRCSRPGLAAATRIDGSADARLGFRFRLSQESRHRARARRIHRPGPRLLRIRAELGPNLISPRDAQTTYLSIVTEFLTAIVVFAGRARDLHEQRRIHHGVSIHGRKLPIATIHRGIWKRGQIRDFDPHFQIRRGNTTMPEQGIAEESPARTHGAILAWLKLTVEGTRHASNFQLPRTAGPRQGVGRTHFLVLDACPNPRPRARLSRFSQLEAPIVIFLMRPCATSLGQTRGTVGLACILIGFAGCSSSSPAGGSSAGGGTSSNGSTANTSAPARTTEGGQGGAGRAGAGGRPDQTTDQTSNPGPAIGGVASAGAATEASSSGGSASAAGGASNPDATSGGSGKTSSSRAGSGGSGNASSSRAGGGGSSATGGVVGKGGGGGAGGKGGDSGARNTTSGGTCGDPIQALRDYLTITRSKRPSLVDQCFTKLPLTKDEAETARGLLVDDHSAEIRETRAAETTAKSITINGKTMRYAFTLFGQKPATGRSLFLSLHGGGEADASVNDEQWENQKQLYQPAEGVYLCPRAPTNTWNLWHEAHIDGLFQRLIEDMIVFQEVNPNRVYVMGYSAGGDGVYQLGPRMADYWAAAAMMAGHPNDAKPDSLRNIGFTIHVGALDTSYDRNLKAQEWGKLLDSLAATDPGGYAHVVQVHANKSHWMDLEDAVAVPWMANFTRNPIPNRVVWLQDDVPHERFYWLRVKSTQAIKATRMVAEVQGQTVKLEASGVNALSVRFSDGMLDLDQPVTISAGSKTLFSGTVPRTIATLATTLQERGDEALMFSGEVEVSLE